MKRPILVPALLLAGTHSLFAHAGHHHDSGLPDFAAHLALGFQYLALLVLPAAAIALFLRAARRKKSAANQKIRRQP